MRDREVPPGRRPDPIGTDGQPSSASAFRTGTHRVCPPEQTWATIRPLLPAFGITRVASVTGLDRLGVPVWQAIRPSSRNLAVSQGKGLSPTAAKVSAAMEAIELWHAERVCELPQARSSVREMGTRSACRPEQLPWRDGRVIDYSARVPWIGARALGEYDDAWVPAEMIELRYDIEPPTTARLFRASSNGLASGNTFDEAVLHGLCEVIERHALFLAAAGVTKKAALDLDAGRVPCEALATCIDGVLARGAKLSLYDVSLPLGGVRIPVVFAELVMADLPRIWIGSGCHLDPRVAAARAVTEAVQSRLTFIAGARDDLVYDTARSSPDLAYRQYNAPSPTANWCELADSSAPTVSDSLAVLLKRLRLAEVASYVVDLTRRPHEIPVVKVIVPSFREGHHA